MEDWMCCDSSTPHVTSHSTILQPQGTKEGLASPPGVKLSWNKTEMVCRCFRNIYHTYYLWHSVSYTERGYCTHTGIFVHRYIHKYRGSLPLHISLHVHNSFTSPFHWPSYRTPYFAIHTLIVRLRRHCVYELSCSLRLPSWTVMITASPTDKIR